MRQLSKRFGRAVAADCVSLAVEQGEMFFLLGPSGCGKTTLLRCIAGFCEPDSGEVLFDGVSASGLPAHRRNTGMVFQNFALWPHMTVAQNVEFGLKMPDRRVGAAERRARVAAMLEAVRMGGFADRTPNQLSGGQQQRVALARALVIEPGCLLLDEPLSNLDAKLRLEMRGEIRRLVKGTGTTAVYVTHDQTEALSMADRCAVLRDGRLEQVGTPRELYERPANRFVADFIGAANILPATVIEAGAGWAMVSTALGPWRAHAPDESLCRPGAAAAVCVRPERVLPGPGAVNSFSGTVADWSYLGAVAECWIETPAAVRLKAVLSDPHAGAPGAGGRTDWHVKPEDALLLR